MRIIDMGKRSLAQLEGDAFNEEDPETLRDIIDELVDMVRELEDELSSVKVSPSTNKSLAEAVQAFAEWQTAGYGRDNETRSLVGQALWLEVSKHVRAVTGCQPADVGADSAQLDLLAAPGDNGVSSSGPAQQSLFALS